ncbi:hypothetical protein [Gloeocapsopsis dulcis]|nr:hypothetical protein [Gloeocapsopsis dulcis]WNN87286.1 hypothetical protein P0S91_13155 [Gloeocapsopsis dulcis]
MPRIIVPPPKRRSAQQANDQAHRTQITFAAQPTSLRRSGAATC